NAKAQRMDREMGSEYARFGVASGLATAIFFGSFSGGERRGVTVPSLRLALLHEEIPPAIVGDALQRLEDELWFLHVEGGLYQFRSQPNLNRVILEREEGVGEDDVAEEIRTRLERMAGHEMRVTLFPTALGDIPDSRDLKLAILGGDHPGRAPATTHFAEELLARAGTAFRAYRNTLLLLAPDAGEFGALQKQVKRLLALRSIQGDRTLLQTFSDEDKQALQGKLKDAEGAMDFQLLSAYRHLARASGDGVRWLDLGIPTTGERGSLAKRVREFLRSQDLLLDRLAPRHVLEKALGPEEQEKPLSEVYEAFLRYPHLPLLESEEVLQQAVAQGVRDGVFGVRSGERISFHEPPGEYVGQLEAVLLRPEVAARAKAEAEGEIPPEIGEEDEDRPKLPEIEAVEVVRHVTLRVQVPWDHMSDFIRGVLVPLHSDEAELRVEIRVDAHSPTGIKKTTLEQKVRETLRQIEAEVLEEHLN
ncbi:MAG: ATP-binding protein, partial [Anaerolineae bacterium]